jgi:hypothetical protein
LGVVETGGFTQDVAVSGAHAFLADNAAGLRIIDVSDPTQPFSTGVYRSNARHATADGQLVYLAADTLQVLDVSDPARPIRIANLEGWFEDVLLAGDYAYLGGYQLTTVDVRNPTTPMVQGMRSVSSNWRTRGMALDGPYACLALNWDGVQILDLSVPAEPRQVGAYYSDAPVWDVAIRGDVACVTLGSELPGIEVIDMRDFQRPIRTAKVSLPLASNVAFMGSYACVTGEGLQVFDLGDPQQPVRVGSHNFGSETGGLQVIGGLAYVAAGEYGLAIYRLTPQLRLNPPVIDRNGMRLSWLGGPGIRLQRTMSLAGPVWQDVPNSEGVSSLRFLPTNTTAFFRLVRP